VWLRVPALVRGQATSTRSTCGSVPDAEPRFVPAVRRRAPVHAEPRRGGEQTLECHNPVTSYRWILTGGPTAYAWVNGTGLHLRDVPDSADFRLVTLRADSPPGWPLDAVVYQVFPDRFARSAAADTRPLPTGQRPAGGTTRST
jgi:alpha-glucosidase